MSLVAIAASLRAQITADSSQRAWRMLGSGLGIEARADGSWRLWRKGVEPSDLEVKTFARDAKLNSGFVVDSNPHQGNVIRRVAPLEEAPETSTHQVCPECRARSLALEHGEPVCPACGHGRRADVPLMLEEDDDTAPWSDATTPAPVDANPYPVDADDNPLDALERDVVNRHDLRPGLPLLRPRSMQPGRLYHFCAFGVLWTVKLERYKDPPPMDHRLYWANLEPVEGPHGGHYNGALEDFSTWFKRCGSLSPLEPPERWRGAK
jgi:hypothetical protein